jgi:hypothetical protein
MLQYVCNVCLVLPDVVSTLRLTRGECRDDKESQIYRISCGCTVRLDVSEIQQLRGRELLHDSNA